jgi:LPXTG-motif cell wall-anchored protein
VVSRTATSADAAVNGAWNTVPPTTDVVASNVLLPGGATNVFTIAVVFSVNSSADSSTFKCSSAGAGHGLFNAAALTSGDVYADTACVDITVKVPVKPAKIPSTGFENGSLIWVGAGLLGLGVLLLITVRRRRTR